MLGSKHVIYEVQNSEVLLCCLYLGLSVHTNHEPSVLIMCTGFRKLAVIVLLAKTD